MAFLTPLPLPRPHTSRRNISPPRRPRHHARFAARTPRPSPRHVATSHSLPEMRALILSLRRQKLSLLLSDVIFRVRTEAPIPPDELLLRLISLSKQLSECQQDAPVRSQIRCVLWELRNALTGVQVSKWLRQSLEIARGCSLDIPRNNGDGGVRQNLHMLMTDNTLLEELSALRKRERNLQRLVDCHHPQVAAHAQRAVAAASANLGIDEYRVRGKSRLADAVRRLETDLGLAVHSIDTNVTQAAHDLVSRLITSLQMDLTARSPAGEAMLLRPRMDDIPNFDMVSEIFLRGGQPSAAGLNWLRMYGVSTIIDLRGSDRENQWHMPDCRQLCLDGSEMHFCNIAIEDFCTPTLEQVQQFVGLVNRMQKSRKVVFVHCKAGIGRTGTMIACWRVAAGADVDEALGKERLYSEGGGGLRQENFVREFAAMYKQGGEKQ